MIREIVKNNLSEIKDSFINYDNLNLEFNNNPFAKLIVLYDNNKIIGYIYYSDIYDRVEINQIEIAEEHRNQGKGNLLLSSFINLIKKSITLEVAENNIYAIKLYKKNGFIEVAKREKYYNGIDAILMIRDYKL